MLDYTKIKQQSTQLNNSSKDIITISKEQEDIKFYQQNDIEITHSDEVEYINLRIKCLSLFEQIKDQTRDIVPPLFDKLTIEDLMELIEPDFVNKMDRIHF